MTTDPCDAEVRAKRTPAGGPDAWRPCRNPAAGDFQGARFCTVHLGIAASGRAVQLQDGRVVRVPRPRTEGAKA